MHKIGSGVISDTTAMQAQGSVAKLSRGHSRETNIDSHRLQMQAVQGHAVPVGPEILVAPRRPVAANHVNFGGGPCQGNSKIMEQIQHPRIVLVNLASPVVTQIVIDPRQSTDIVHVPMTVLDVEPFPGVGVKETKAVRHRERRVRFGISHDPGTRETISSNRYHTKPKAASN